jgi:hypothetical protein
MATANWLIAAGSTLLAVLASRAVPFIARHLHLSGSSDVTIKAPSGKKITLRREELERMSVDSILRRLDDAPAR